MYVSSKALYQLLSSIKQVEQILNSDMRRVLTWKIAKKMRNASMMRAQM